MLAVSPIHSEDNVLQVDEAQMDTVKGREYSKELSYANSVKEGGGLRGWIQFVIFICANQRYSILNCICVNQRDAAFFEA